MLRMTWKVSACPKRMCSPGINGEGELRGNRLTQVHLEKWPLKRSVRVCARCRLLMPLVTSSRPAANVVLIHVLLNE